MFKNQELLADKNILILRLCFFLIALNLCIMFLCFHLHEGTLPVLKLRLKRHHRLDSNDSEVYLSICFHLHTLQEHLEHKGFGEIVNSWSKIM